MKYLCLVVFDEKKLDALSKSESDALTAESLAYNEVLQKSGHFIAAQALQPVHAATTVRAQAGKVSVTDGPFAETNEQLGGFILINAQDLKGPSKWHQRSPSFAWAASKCAQSRS